MRPLKFRPYLKQTIWGGERIIPLKHLDSTLDQVGESWEVSGVEGHESVVSGGEYDGKKINELIAELKGSLIGEDNYRKYGTTFPLLIKYLDVQQDISVQVHPNDEMAHHFGMPNGKTEMWYIMKSDDDASLRCGLKKAITPEQYKAMVADNTICDAIVRHKVKEGDCFYIPGGRIHAAGKGCLIAEIQQTSDSTFRIYDYNRRGKDGKLRELHTEQAAQCIDYTVLHDYRTQYAPEKNMGVPLVSSEYFQTTVYDLDEPMTLDYSELDSFVILMCVAGEGTFTDNEGNETSLRIGETMLVPATTETISVSGTVKLLETFV